MLAFEIEEFLEGQEKEISSFIKKVYDEFVAPDYSDEGNIFFHDFIEPEKFLSRLKNGDIIFIAKSGNEIAGIIEIRGNNTISLLFVDKKFMKHGVAKTLFEKALIICKQRNAALDKFSVHASPYSVRAYERLGFKASAGMQEENGILYLPMEMEISVK